MKETFESNLSASQKEEMADQKAYEDLKAAKEDEIAAGQAQIDASSRTSTARRRSPRAFRSPLFIVCGKRFPQAKGSPQMSCPGILSHADS